MITLWNILKQDVQNDVTSLNTKNIYLPFKQVVTREWCNPPNLSFRANGHTKSQGTFLPNSMKKGKNLERLITATSQAPF